MQSFIKGYSELKVQVQVASDIFHDGETKANEGENFRSAELVPI